jgi:hypothetical protein
VHTVHGGPKPGDALLQRHGLGVAGVGQERVLNGLPSSYIVHST